MTSEPTPIPTRGPKAPLASTGFTPTKMQDAPMGKTTHGQGAFLRRAKGLLPRLLVAAFALWMFLVSIQLLKTGAGALAPALSGSTLTDSAASSLGFGWIAAMMVMSGSPIAVSALALLDGGVLSVTETFTMLTGSRLGASFVVLVVAFIYALRGNASKEQRHASLSIGLFALIMTAIVYIPALGIGVPLLQNGAFDGMHLKPPGAFIDVIDKMVGPVLGLAKTYIPGGWLFPFGVLVLLGSIKILDRALPDADDATHLEEHTDWRRRKWVMFGIGSGVALVTMSVSVALTVLVPAVSKGYFRRRQVIPYIMGANIMTLGDTLLTAFVMNNPAGVHVVLAEVIGTFAITLILLTLFYGPLSRFLVATTDAILSRRRWVALFCAGLLTIPVSLILFVPVTSFVLTVTGASGGSV